MPQEKKYIISTESKYIKDYQNEHYRALILDENGRKGFCARLRAALKKQGIAARVSGAKSAAKAN